MSNNCCATPVTEGGTWLDSRIISGELQSPTMTGTVTLDDAALHSLATQLCSALHDCIVNVVNNGTFDNVTLRDSSLANATLTGTLNIADSVKILLHAAISNLIKTQVDNILAVALQNWDITGNKLINVTADNMTATDTLLKGTTTISGQVPLDTDAREHLITQLAERIRSIAEEVIVADKDVMASVFQDCEGVPRAPGVRIPSCQDMNDAISLAMSQLPALDVISGVSYDPETHILTITTQLSPEGGQQKWEVHLDSLGGQVVADGVTITGTGVTGDPLKVKVSEATDAPEASTGTDVPTAIYGSRTAVLGTPDKWLDFDGYLIPVFNKPSA